MSEYIGFRLAGRSESGKTKLWIVHSRSQKSPLGMVRWHGAWRRYCFFPHPSTVWSPGCLDSVASFCREKTKEHREQRQPA